MTGSLLHVEYEERMNEVGKHLKEYNWCHCIYIVLTAIVLITSLMPDVYQLPWNNGQVQDHSYAIHPQCLHHDHTDRLSLADHLLDHLWYWCTHHLHKVQFSTALYNTICTVLTCGTTGVLNGVATDMWLGSLSTDSTQ